MGQYYKPIILAENKKIVKSFVCAHSFNNGLKLMEHSWMKNNFVKAFETLIKENPQRVLWAGDYAEPEKGYKNNTYKRCKDELEVKPENQSTNRDKYIVNHTQKTFVDKTKVPKDKDGWQIHPLPILTCEGNGQGGGDLYVERVKGNVGLIGSWSRDKISIECIKPKAFNEVYFDLIEM